MREPLPAMPAAGANPVNGHTNRRPATHAASRPERILSLTGTTPPGAASRNGARKTTVVIADSLGVMRAAVRAILERSGGFFIEEAATGEELAQVSALLQPDLALIDLDLAPRGGIDAVVRLGEVASTRAILWTLRVDAVDVLTAVRAGAVGFLNKDIPPDGLVRALRAAADGEAALSRAAASSMLSELRALEDKERARARTAALSDREREVLALISDGCRNREIAERLFISELTVKRHVQNILRKVGRSSRVEAAQLFRAAAQPLGAIA
jgi:DNA-binding NarL/FixJ family response regulator